MTLTDRQRIDRLRKRLTELELWTVRADGSARRLDLQRQAASPTARRGRPATASWRSPICEVEVPADWPLEEARLDLDLGGEGLLRIAYADGGAEAFGLDPNHQRFPLTGRRFAVSAECVARLPFGVPNRGRPASPAPG